jgi:hypothetical protein
MGQTEPHFLSDPMSDRKKKFSLTLRNIYKKTAWCTTLHGENAVNFLCTPKLALEGTLHPQKFGCTYKGLSIDASYQVSVHLAEGFQRRRLKCEKLTDDGRQVMAKAR